MDNISEGCRFSYNDLDDSLIISCKDNNENVRENFAFDNFIFSLTRAGKIVGMQIREVSRVLSDYNINPNLLGDLIKVNLIVLKKKNCIGVAILLDFNEQKAKISIPIPELMVR